MTLMMAVVHATTTASTVMSTCSTCRVGLMP